MTDSKKPSKEEEKLEPISISEEITLHDETAEEKEKEDAEPLFPTDEHLRPPIQQYNL